ncbi:MAG: T9SS type A sorting domain-containing protein [Flavobacteriales bacterium]
MNTGSNILNDGSVRVLGDWNNSSGGTGVNGLSTGTVELYGIGLQNISGVSVTDFRNLLITGGQKQLQQNVVVGLPGQEDGTLELGVGSVLLLNDRTFSVFNPAGTAVLDNGGWISSESLIGRFQWALGADVSEHRVPFGTPTGPVFPFAFTPSAPYPINTLLGIATYPTAPDNTPYPLTANQQVLNMAGTTTMDNSAQTEDRLWLVYLPNGNFNGDMLLSYAPADDPAFGPGPVRAQQWLESAGTWEPPLPGQTNPGVREVRVPNVLFSDAITPTNEHIWALAYEDSPLPISLIHFGAVPENNRVVLCTWTTASQLNNDYFTVERSRDGTSYESIGTVAGAGTTNSVLHYAFNDPEPYEGVSYYRLRQTDFDGTTDLSEAVPVRIERNVELVVFPNPNNGQFTIQRTSAEDPLFLEIFDSSGRLVQRLTMASEIERLSVDVPLTSGMYSLRWDGGQAKLSIER